MKSSITSLRRLGLCLGLCALLCGCSGGNGGTTRYRSADDAPLRDGRELFFSDSLNACFTSRPYPVPSVSYVAPPKGYKPVYISSYARHGSRKLHRTDYLSVPLSVFEAARASDCLTPLGEEVERKLKAIGDDMGKGLGDLTSVGAAQHRGIGERMCANYPNVFRKGAEIRFWSTPVQRTMLSMFACNARIAELCPKVSTVRQSSAALKYLEAHYDDPYKNSPHDPADNFIRDNLDCGAVLGRLFTAEVPSLRNEVEFLRDIYICGSITAGLDLAGIDFLWDVFTHEELFVLQQAMSYMMYVRNGNSPELGHLALPAMKPLLEDFVRRADAALEQPVPGADLRFGHDQYLVPFAALIGINGRVAQEEDPLKVIDTFQDFVTAPMAGNISLVFYRNRDGDILVKALQNEVEAFLPLDTDLWPYYHWTDLRNYFNSILETD